MTNRSNDAIWNLLSKYNFQLVDDKITDVLCSVCDQIMVEPHAGECGCQYCLKCITEHLKVRGSNCPCSKCDLSDRCLVIGKNVIPTYPTEKKIFTLIVKCPNNLCTKVFDLREMEEHLRLCGMNTTDCPYKLMGCNDEKWTMNTIKEHLESEVCKHSELVAESFDHLQNDVNRLQEILKMKEKDVEDLKEDAARKAEIMENMKEVIESQKTQIEDLRKEVKEVETSTISTINTKIDDLFAEVKQIRLYEEGDFIWRINNFLLKDGFKRRSLPFYRNSFKMYLRVGLDETSIGIGCYLMRSEFDEYNDWPMKCTVSLAIVDQDSLEPWKKQEFSYNTKNNEGFCKPKNDINETCIGNDDFASVSEMEQERSIWRNDCLVVLCVVTPVDDDF